LKEVEPLKVRISREKLEEILREESELEKGKIDDILKNR